MFKYKIRTLLLFLFVLNVTAICASDKLWLHEISSYIDSLAKAKQAPPGNVVRWYQSVDSLLDCSPIESSENAKLIFLFGKTAYELGDNAYAFSFFKKYLQLADDEDLFTEETAYTHYYIGVLYQWYADYNYALISYSNALEYSKYVIHQEEFKGDVNKSIGNLYFHWLKYDKAISFYRNSLELYKSINDSLRISKSLNNMGRIFGEQGKYTKALNLLKASLDIKMKYSDFPGIFNSYINMGHIYQKLGNYDEVHEHYDFALSLASRLKNRVMLAEVMNYKGDLSFHKGLLDLAKNQYAMSLEYADSSDSKRWLLEGHEALSAVLEEQQDFENALLHFKQYELLKDSVFDEETRILIQFYKFETENLNKQWEITDKENTVNVRKIWILGVIGAFLFVLTFVYFLWRHNKLVTRKSKKIVKINQELDLRVKERTRVLEMTQYAIDMATDPFFVIMASGEIAYCNEASLFLLGYNREDLKQLKFFDIVKGFSQSLWETYWNDIQQTGSRTIELVFVGQSDDQITMEVALNYRAFQEQRRMYVFCRNIEERKNQERELRKAKEEAERSDQLKSAFLANMSHEIRTPLNAIVGFSGLLAAKQIAPHKRDRILEIIKANSEDLITLINDIIDFSMIEADQMTTDKKLYYIQPLLEELIDVFKSRNVERQNKDVDIRLNMPANARFYALYTDKIRLRQVLNNLINNALKFTDKGFVELGFTLITVGGRKMIRMYVKDTGIGISEEEQKYIFERFRKLDVKEQKAQRGTGLGLSISKRLAGMLDGNLHVTSSVGKGSIFYLDMPYQFMESKFIGERSVKELQVPMLSGITILVVEDELSSFLLLEAMLAETQATLVYAANGKIALDLLGSEKKIDVVFLDIYLSGENGLVLAQNIKKTYPQLPVIAQTAYSFSDNEKAARDNNCDGFIRKPISKTELYETLIELFK